MINKYLKALLSEHKRVIIPDFGAFIIKHSASGDIVSFNEFLKLNDGIFADEIIKQEGGDRDAALDSISKMVADIEITVREKGYYELYEIGYLIKDSKETICLVSELEESLKEDVEQVVVPVIEPDETLAASVEVDNEAIAEPINEAVDDDDKKKKRLIIILIVAVLLIVLVAFSIFFTSSDKSNKVSSADSIEHIDSSLLHKHEQLVADKADRAMEEMASDVNKGTWDTIVDFFSSWFSHDDEIEKVTAIDASKKGSSEVYALIPNSVDIVNGIEVVADRDINIKGKERYNVIIASYSEMKNAKHRHQSLIDDEYASKMFERHNGFVAVSMGGYPSLDIALRVCGEKLNEVPDIWILVK